MDTIEVVAVVASILSLTVAIIALLLGIRNDQWMRLSNEEQYATYLEKGQVKHKLRLYLGPQLPREGKVAYPVILESDGVTPPHPVKLRISDCSEWCRVSFRSTKLKLDRKNQRKTGDNQEKIFTLQTLKDREDLFYIEINRDRLMLLETREKCLAYVFMCCGKVLSGTRELFLP